MPGADTRAANSVASLRAADAALTLVVNPVDIAAGDTVAVTGTGFLAAETVDVQLATTGAVTSTEHLHYFKADASGGVHLGRPGYSLGDPGWFV